MAGRPCSRGEEVPSRPRRRRGREDGLRGAAGGVGRTGAVTCPAPHLRAGLAGSWLGRRDESRPRCSPVRAAPRRSPLRPGALGAAPERESWGGVGTGCWGSRRGSRPRASGPLPRERAFGRSRLPPALALLTNILCSLGTHCSPAVCWWWWHSFVKKGAVVAHARERS